MAGFSQVSQAPIGRRNISNPASYINIWGKIRATFAQQPLAKRRGYTPGHFSFNAKGACPECKAVGGYVFAHIMVPPKPGNDA